MARAKPDRSPPPPLDSATLERLALRYVERFATTRARLVRYLEAKIRARGWEGAPPDPIAIAERLAALGYIDDQGFGAARAAAMARRGLGARRIRPALRHAGVAAADVDHIVAATDEQALDAALAFAKRRRIGPFAPGTVDDNARRRQLAAMMRAGHSYDISKKIAEMLPDDAALISNRVNDINSRINSC